MTQHKWAKEIHAWADGAEIEQSLENASGWTDWHNVVTPTFYTSGAEFRIKQQPKEKKYLYVYQLGFEFKLSPLKKELMQFSAGDRAGDFKYVGKIEVQDD